MDALSLEELAERSGAAAADVERMAELGILEPAPGDRPFTVRDVRRVRLVDACVRAGLPLDGIGSAVASGKLSFRFLDLPQYAWSGYSDRTYRQASDELGLSVDLVLGIHEAVGLPVAGPDELLREDDLELLPVLNLGVAAGMSDEVMIRLIRVYGESLRRIAQAEGQFYQQHVEGPPAGLGLELSRVLEAGSAFGAEYMAFMDRVLLGLYHRQQESAWLDNLVGHIEDALEDMGLHRRLERPPAMCFLDLVGYTRLTDERGDVAAVELAAGLAGLVQGMSQRHGGRPVKWLGDGVMLFFKDPGGAVASALEMVERTPSAELHPAHVGIEAGPVIQQEGDYYGRTVNVAARIAAMAGPGEILVSESVVESSSPAGVRFEGIGSVELKNVSRPIALFRALRR